MTRFIPSEEISANQVQHWKFGDVGLGGASGFVPLEPLDGGGLEPLSLADKRHVPAVEMSGSAAQDGDVDDDVAVLEEAPAEPPPPPGIPEEEVQSMLEQARQEAYQQGVQQGEQKAAAEWQARMSDYQNNLGREAAQRLSEVVTQAQSSIKGLQQQVAPDVLQLACDVARQVVRQELRTNPQALLPVVKEALDMLGAETKPATVRLHPDDWAALETHLRAAVPNPKVEWLADASVARGDCRIESAGAVVDGSIERRWQRAVAALGLVSTWYEGAEHGQ